MTAIFLLGKSGDILNSLPIAKHLADTEGKPDWVVAQKYRTILLCASYVNPVPVAFHINEAHRALKFCAAKYDQLLVAQAYGKTWMGRRDKPHNVCAWLTCGFTEEQFHDVDRFPLVLDRRDRAREDFLYRRHVKSDRPLILLAVGCARSAPFASHGIFTAAIQRKWGESCFILDLCKIKAARLYDLLGIMERARLLITADTSALHLVAAAPRVPTIVLRGDSGFTAARPRFKPCAVFSYNTVIREMTRMHGAIYDALTLPHGRPELPDAPECDFDLHAVD